MGRSLRKRIVTTYGEASRAFNKVRGELWKLGVLWDGSKLDRVQCFFDPFTPVLTLAGFMGYYQFKDRTIHFPAVYSGVYFRKGDHVPLPIPAWIDKNSPSDVFRHEFGHALAHRYRNALNDGDLFRKAFEGPYGERPAPGTDPEDWEGRCVSRYAAKKTQEDFAETFMLFVKHKGKIPEKFSRRPAIRRKWKAVAEIMKRVAASPR